MKTLLAFLLLCTSVQAATLNVPASYPTIQSAVDAAVAGDTVVVAAGTYLERVTTKSHGTAVSPITLIGTGMPSWLKLTLSHDYWQVKNVRLSGETTSFGHLLYFNGADNCLVDGVTVDANYALKVYGICWKTNGGSDNVIQNSVIQKVRGYPMLNMDGDRNLFHNNVVQDGYDVDFVRLFGSYNVIRRNVFRNNVATPAELGPSGFHPDFIQTFGDNWNESHDQLIEQNLVTNLPVAQLTQLSATGHPDIRDWTFRNNVFVNSGLGASCTIPGVKYINNTFYRCNYISGGHVLNMGQRPFKANDGLNSAHPDYALTVNPTTSGNIAADAWYRVVVDETPQNGILNGVVYKARTRNLGRVVYAGVEYSNGQLFTGTTDPNWTKGGPLADQGTLQVYVEGGLTYNGLLYNRTSSATNDYIFKGVAGVTTFTTPSPEIRAYRVVLDSADRVEVRNNVFLDCGTLTNNTNGWYSFSLQTVSQTVNNNYVAKNGFLPVKADALNRPIGNPGGWSSQAWYESNGRNGGNPGFTDLSNSDFRLQSTSILVDAGVNVSGVVSDYAGTVRPLGVRTDIGAYEYDDGNPPPPPVDPDPEPDTVPVPPTSLAPGTLASVSVTLTWDDVSDNELNFELQRSLNNSTWVAQATVAANVETYTVTGLTPSTVYYFRIRAVGTAGPSAYTASLAVTTPAVPPPAPSDPPAAPTELSSIAIGHSGAALSWVHSGTGVTKFELERSPDGVAWVKTNDITAPATQFLVSGLSAASTYYWRLRGVGPTGNSAWSGVSATTTAVLPPTRAVAPRRAAGDGLTN